MRSNQQNYPFAMDNKSDFKMNKKSNNYPFAMDNQEIL